MKKPELLLPAGSWPGLKAALPYADAVYFGSKALNMRQRAGNFTTGEISKVASICHERGIKAYLAVNTVIYRKDAKTLEKLMDAAKKAKIDAVICWDFAVIDAARKRKIPVHISTQANVSNAKTAELYKNLGAERVVLARECSLDDIKQIKKDSRIEIEAFVHGAMCVSVSGRCYLSSYLYGKSANCGDCLQPCRQQWTLENEDKKKVACEGKYLLSAKDLCMIGHIPELVKAGIGSFKVEGRMRDSRYVETVGRCYREAIDAYFEGNFTKKKVWCWHKELESVYNRGFSTGFYFKKPGRKEFTYGSSNTHATMKRTQAGIVTNFYPKAGVAAVRVLAGTISVMDEAVIEGRTTYFRQKIESIELNGSSVKSAKKGDIIGLKVKNRARKNDAVYLLVSNKRI